LLELGAGSGLISIFSTNRGAHVTATDINPIAIEGLKINKQMNLPNSDLTILESDLFDLIPQQLFQYIIINPPYYPKQPVNIEEQAWFCGEHYEYFEKLFSQINQYISAESVVWISLSESCNIKFLKSIAAKNHLRISVYKKQNVWEKHYIYCLNQDSR